MHGRLRRCLQEVLYVLVIVEVVILLFIFQGAFISGKQTIDSIKSSGNTIDNAKRGKSPVNLNSHSASLLTGNNPDFTGRQHPLTCREIDHMVLNRPLGRGTTKTVYRSTFAGQPVAVKMVTSDVKDIVACRKKKGNQNINSCFKFAQYKMMKEIALLHQLKHPNVAQLLGSCIRDDLDGKDKVMMIMELGKPVDLRKMAWPVKLKAALDIAELLHFFHNSPIGRIRIGDFKRDQFRLINGTVKISDLDDLTVEEQSCQDVSDCYILGRDRGVSCTEEICKDFNTIANIKVANKIFFTPVLSNAPKVVQHDCLSLLDALRQPDLETEELRNRLGSIKTKYDARSANR